MKTVMMIVLGTRPARALAMVKPEGGRLVGRSRGHARARRRGRRGGGALVLMLWVELRGLRIEGVLGSGGRGGGGGFRGEVGRRARPGKRFLGRSGGPRGRRLRRRRNERRGRRGWSKIRLRGGRWRGEEALLHVKDRVQDVAHPHASFLLSQRWLRLLRPLQHPPHAPRSATSEPIQDRSHSVNRIVFTFVLIHTVVQFFSLFSDRKLSSGSPTPFGGDFRSRQGPEGVGLGKVV
jgi:hypothetical protein